MTLGNDGSSSRGEASLDELVARRVAATPDALAVSDGCGHLTYGELGARADRVARRLRAAGIGEEARVAICLERSAELIVAMLGTLRSGAAYVPLDPAYPEARRGDMMDLSGASAVITLAESGGSWLGQAALIPIDGIADRPPEIFLDPLPGGPSRLRDPERLAYVIFTSGSTGRPKGVAMSHRGAVHIASWCQSRYGWCAADRGTQVSGPGFDAAVIEIWPALISGASLHVPAAETRLAAATFLHWLAQEGITIAWSPTAIVESLLGEPEPPGLVLRYLQTGGDRLRRIPAPGASFRLANQYGPAENAVITTEQEVEHAASGALPRIGRPIEGVRVEILDLALHPVPEGEIGEIAASGRGLARGYLGDPAQTAERFVPDPFSGECGGRMYRSGDRARWLAPGPQGRDLDFIGRLDTQVKIRGQRIELGEIEAALAALPFVREAAVLLREGEARRSGPPGEPCLVAWIAVDSEGEEPDDRTILEALRRTLPEAMVPLAVLRLDRLPLTPNGKVDRRALASIAAGRPAVEPSHSIGVPPRTAMEARLAAIWAEIFDVESVSVRTPFLDLGGHSLLAVRLLGRIRAEIGRSVPLASLLGDRTIEALAARLDREDRSAGLSYPEDLVAIARAEGSLQPPLFFVHAVGGGVLSYVALARALGRGQPFWGIMAPSAADLPEATIEVLAARYVAAIRRIRSRGPYFLGGWSMGGVVAFEMARQIEAMGEEVALVALLDVSAPLADGPEADDATVAAWFARELATLAGRDWQLDPAALQDLAAEPEAAKLLALGRAAGVFDASFSAGLDGADLAPLLAVLRRNYRALVAFEPRPWHGPAVLFAAEKGYGRAGAAAWQALAPAAEVIDVGGDHHSLLAPPHVQNLADRLAEKLAVQQAPTLLATAEGRYQQSGQTDSQAEMQSVSETTHQGGQESHDWQVFQQVCQSVHRSQVSTE